MDDTTYWRAFPIGDDEPSAGTDLLSHRRGNTHANVVRGLGVPVLIESSTELAPRQSDPSQAEQQVGDDRIRRL